MEKREKEKYEKQCICAGPTPLVLHVGAEHNGAARRRQGPRANSTAGCKDVSF